MGKKLVILFLMFMYLYTLTCNVFMTAVFRIPTPILFSFPLVFLFSEPTSGKYFSFKKEIAAFFVSAALLFLVALEEIPTFFSTLIIAGCCAMYFNYFVGNNLSRLKTSVLIFYAVLFLSSIIMLLNHLYPSYIDALRAILVGDIITQSPSGITTSIFSFGYQLAALTTFLIISVSAFKKSIILLPIALSLSLLFIFYGMNRSALVVVFFSVGIFWLLYFRLKVVLIFAVLAIFVVSFSSSLEDLSTGRQQNILAKNEKSGDEKRGALMIENLKIIADHPYGLIFYGKSWNEVARYNPAFKKGEQGLVTSHNAYLMFVTYVGILPALLLLWLIYHRIIKAFLFSLKHIRTKQNALLTSLCFSFLAISVNALFHNEWLIQSGGPTLFLYFCILHLFRLQVQDESKDSVTQPSLTRSSVNTSV